jgi:hypothetical protein
MSFGQNQTSPQPVSLISDTSRICGALAEIHSRIAKIGDTLHGSESANQSGVPAPPAPLPVPTVRRNLNDALGLINLICNEISRLENWL